MTDRFERELNRWMREQEQEERLEKKERAAEQTKKA